MSMIIIKGEFSFFFTVSSIKESGMLSADSNALSISYRITMSNRAGKYFEQYHF